jgi:HAD superfamily hydrolase (TIGR01509 family)
MEHPRIPDERAVDVILFDVMDTLVHDPFYVEMPAFFGLTFEDWLRAKNPSVWVPFERGELDERELLRALFADARAFDHAGFLRMLHASYRYLDGVEELLSEVSDRGVAMHAFSNYPCWYSLIESAVGLSRYVSWTFVSCNTGMRKPDEAAYRHALDRLAVPPERVLFVDDRAVNVEAAESTGMLGHVFRDATSLRATLMQLKLL